MEFVSYQRVLLGMCDGREATIPTELWMEWGENGIRVGVVLLLFWFEGDVPRHCAQPTYSLGGLYIYIYICFGGSESGLFVQVVLQVGSTLTLFLVQKRKRL